MKSTDREAERQRRLLRALRGDTPAGMMGNAGPAVLAGWLRDDGLGPRTARGLAAYRATAGALAERALAAAYPTLQQLLGDESFAALARAFWHRHPPRAGDIALWGAALPGFVADAPTLADEPYLADLARLEWAFHRIQTAPDVAAALGLELLAGADPARLQLQLVPGSALVSSRYPIATLWQAHRTSGSDGDSDRFAPVRAAFAAGAGEHALVTRQGWRPCVQVLDAAAARFTAALLAGRTLARALHAAGDGFDFEAWLIAALRQRGLAQVAEKVTTSPPKALPIARTGDAA